MARDRALKAYSAMRKDASGGVQIKLALEVIIGSHAQCQLL